MSKINVLKGLQKNVLNRIQNEADTRFKIIDKILKSILNWPDNALKLEENVKSGYIDYCLYSPLNKPIIVIEAKREGKTFSIPTSVAKGNLFRKILTEELLTTKNISDAIYQAKSYAEDKGCNYVAVTNGHEWIFTHIVAQDKPWKKQYSYVITSLDYFEKNFTDAINNFSYYSITANASLRKLFFKENNRNGEAYYPKNSIIAYDTPVSNNPYAGIFNLIGRKYFSNIPLEDYEFMRNCYVTDKGHHDALQKSVRGFIYDSLTPYFKRLGVIDLYDDKKGGSLGMKIQEIIRRENLNSVLIIFGGRGSGKSTFVERFLFYIQPREVKQYSIISIINLIDSAQNTEHLTNQIWNDLLLKIDVDGILKSDREALLSLFESEFKIYEKQFLVSLDKNSIDYQRLVSEFLNEKITDPRFCCEKLSLYWKNRSKGLIVVLDNMDQLPSELQDICFLTSIEIAKKLNCLVIIAMREERYYNARQRGVLDAYHNNGFHISSPVITKVLIKRISYVIKKMEESNNREVDFDIRSDKQFDIVREFLIICSKQLNKQDSEFSLFLRNTTHGDARQALSFFKSFTTSGYTNINEMTSKGSWTFGKHQVLKPIMIPERFFYNEMSSHIPNIFQIRNEKNGSHFTALRILTLLDEKSNDTNKHGFIDTAYLIQTFDLKYFKKDDCVENLNMLLEKGYIEANNRLDEYSNSVDKIRITSSGKYMIDNLYKDFTYIDLICLDTAIFSEKISSELVLSAMKELDLFYESDFYGRILIRIEKTENFINYLQEAETYEFEEFNLSGEEVMYSLKIKEDFEQNQKERILRSAMNNT